jgi:hypothetical protein
MTDAEGQYHNSEESLPQAQDTDVGAEEGSSEKSEAEKSGAETVRDDSPAFEKKLSGETSDHIANLSGNDQPAIVTTAPDRPALASAEPNKRLSDAEPEELAHALKQVFTGTEKNHPLYTLGSNARTGQAQSVVVEDGPAAKSNQPEAKSGYSNPFSLFADVFYGVLIAPRQTLAILSDCKRFPPTAGNLFLTFVLVLGVLCFPAAIKVGANDSSAVGWLKAAAFVGGNLLDWLVLSFVLYYLSIWLRGNKLTLGNAFIATGWAFLPFAFFAPVACFKSALGGGFTAFACIPALWFLVLEWFAFQISLRTSTIKLALIAIVVPPVFCLVYLFWIGLAVFSLIAQLLSHLT